MGNFRLNKLNLNNKKEKLAFCIFVTVLIGLIAHAYQFFQSSFSHDSLDSIFSDLSEMKWKIALGRFLVPLLSEFRGKFLNPWLIGIISLFLISISVFLIAEIFNVNSKPLLFLMSGIMATNLTIVAMTATYLYELDYDMCALFFAVLAVYFLTKRNDFIFWICGTVSIILSLALYQSYIEVTVVLLIIYFIYYTINDGTAKDTLIKGIKSIAAIILGVALYIAASNVVCRVFNVQKEERTDAFSGLKGNFALELKIMIYKIVDTFANPVTVYNSKLMGLLNFLLVFIGICVCVFLILKYCNSIKEKIIAFSLLICIPFSLNFISLAVGGVVHELMIYSFWIMFVFPLFTVKEAANKSSNKKFFKCLNVICLLIVGIIIWNNIVVANTAYLKKDLENTATVSAMTRVVDDLEERNDYSVGKTEISFVGSVSTMKTMPGFEFLSDTTGLRGSGSISQSGISDHYNLYKSFFNYYLNYPINYSSKDFSDNEKVKNMPTYPEKGYIQNIDGVLVVKMG